MNPHILMVLDHLANPDKYTKEQLKQNADAAAAADEAAYNVDAATYDAGYWLGRYFKQTGENKQDYIDAINKGNKQ